MGHLPALAAIPQTSALSARAKAMIEYNGVYGDFEWEIVGRTLKVFSSQRRVGMLKVFENVNAGNSEQAQWSAQAKIDLNLDVLHGLEAAKIDSTTGT